MTRVIVAGAAGRMGQRIIHMVQAHPGLELSGAFEAEGSPAIGKDAGALSGLGETGIIITAGLESVIDKGDVIIDFTFHAPRSVCPVGGQPGQGHGHRHHRSQCRGSLGP